jgi:hypothetical protein
MCGAVPARQAGLPRHAGEAAEPPGAPVSENRGPVVVDGIACAHSVRATCSCHRRADPIAGTAAPRRPLEPAEHVAAQVRPLVEGRAGEVAAGDVPGRSAKRARRALSSTSRRPHKPCCNETGEKEADLERVSPRSPWKPLRRNRSGGRRPAFDLRFPTRSGGRDRLPRSGDRIPRRPSRPASESPRGSHRTQSTVRRTRPRALASGDPPPVTPRSPVRLRRSSFPFPRAPRRPARGCPRAARLRSPAGV